MTATRKPTALIILDGWGHRDPAEDNAISRARTPFWDQLWAQQPKTLINTSGMFVGLPQGQMGNSEVGHMNLGAGRVVYQSLTRIDKDIEDGNFQHNEVLCAAIDKAVGSGRAVHLMGLLSPGGVHSHEDHILAAAELAASRGAKAVYIHAFLDGRDMPPRSARPSLEKAAAKLKSLGVGRIATLVGRYYAMDRDNRWDRIEAAYNAMVLGEAEFTAADPLEALDQAYERGENDEFVKPTLIRANGEPDGLIHDGDTVLFMNFRADRAREMTRAFVEKSLEGFARRKVPELAEFVMLTEYAADIQAACAYPPEQLTNGLGEYVSKLGKTQLRIAETEKYAHVTFFFNGGLETPFEGEDRILVPSPKVATYDLKPEMSAPEVTDKLVEAIRSGKYDLLICNYANGDMVGHTGKLEAAIKAAECLDLCLKRVVEALDEMGGEALITADHGNCEQMTDPNSGQVHTAHTVGPVPLVYTGPRQVRLKDGGSLSDVAPSLLTLMGLEQPGEMTGHSLVELS
ncbi:2,3-bisphosphoglycerate-independent phosphoglycerate mutase [Marinobacter lutaoensis]|uniref:2,3-bisphosphoglycerate-independent phosphoglycerate mutase n=1 Tax=Marinobacter lutaoensis TaxID=135739 RepID=A0A1V2DSM6_9GAMM|nr:2,3-bisphosphoglycerate-independent phosphoglycerate mutase [Marinobacter lutaoensis]MBI42884.1 2,3-bisphosphoglycerate-independent phosphoglycerate mutase [Oceanospirillales bacterium]NVD34804.1 2,3-bisphosphoglycerate-independent phosphoglycerate mutase [Marinobacter lutaoensis]ONF43612.1 phosphoglycerate mutase (2,3-diphosphoglycerate-independent) [Marinobacter lutaoensis]